MYNVTDTYKTLIKDPVRYVGISGAVRLRSGEIIQITDSNIAAGSLSITSKLNRKGDFRPGGVYSAELSVGLTGVAARTYDLDGAVIRLNYSIYPDNTRKPAEAQTIPLGRFYADGSTIKRSGSVVNLKANDALMLFDIPATARNGTLYELVTGACSSAGVSFGMTQEEFEALPNASAAVSVNTARIQTERDLLMYTGMMTGSFARITRTGELIFVPLSCEKDESTHVIIPVREIAGNIRFQTDFSDDTTRIARLFMHRNGSAIYSTLAGTAAGSEKLATLELDENPLMSEMSDDEVKAALNNLLTRLFECLNRVFNAEFTGDPALETGDYVRLRGGLIDTDRGYATGMITSQVWRYHGNHTIRCSMPSSLIYSGEDIPAVMALAANDTPAVYAGDLPPGRVQPKSQIEKRVDELEARMNDIGGVGMKSPFDESSEIFNCYPGGNNSAGAAGDHCFASARGMGCKASGFTAVADGFFTAASGRQSSAHGSNTTASGVNSHAEGQQTIASGENSHAEGWQAQALGASSHAENKGKATGNCSHAGGDQSEATGYAHFVHGYGVKTVGSYFGKAAFGMYNDDSDDMILTVGNGVSWQRSNAFAVDKDGNIYCNRVIQTGEASAAALHSDHSDEVGVPEYNVRSENIVEFGGITYTFETDENGSITQVTTSGGKNMRANIPAGIGNLQTHNAVFMALAMMNLK